MNGEFLFEGLDLGVCMKWKQFANLKNASLIIEVEDKNW